ncbi:PrsW family glutamic-type intramembrane protease [Methanocella sp. MCL-LM]|uniref:PrsW family glutamic-type intramembrane protease n=1 Tax=Methanocella sp. MCL-LM TaxID=3412035 RepID=UPI003C72CD86
MIEAVFIVTAIPLVFLLAFMRKEQRVFVYFLLWGLVAAMLTYYVYVALSVAGIRLEYSSIGFGPLLEEFLKALPLIALFIVAGKRYDRHILPLAMASGIGFSILENYLYLDSLATGGFSVLLAAATRALTTAVMHGCTTAIVGYGIFLVGNMAKQALPAMLLGLYTTAVTIHAIYNLLVIYSGWGKLLAVLIPLVLILGLLLLFYGDELEAKPDEKACGS